MIVRASLLTAFAVVGALGWKSAAAAETWPTRPVTIVVPYAPGGGTDFTARVVAQQLNDQLHQSFVVQNKAGGSGLLGAQSVATSRSDGYTLLYAGPAIAVSSFMVGNPGLDVQKDLTPVSLATSSPYVLAVDAKLPIHTTSGMVAWIKQHGDVFRWGTSGAGSGDQLASALLFRQAGVNPVSAPYQSGGPMLAAILGGEIHGMMTPLSTTKAQIESGQLRAIGVTGMERMEIAPSIPTVASQGFPGYESLVWFGVWGPKDMPRDVTAEIHRQMQAALANAALRQKIETAGTSVKGSKSPEEFAAYFKSEYDKAGVLVKELNLKSQ